ncbi:PAAR domain-containing protein [Azospirillum agricola]|uniref:PAAR domain-containing protein n=1 Tax=Azospirillum agricola TaxID=1720247 RepID=UPI001AEA43C9
MPSVCRLGDACTGHGCWPPRPNAEASGDVFVNGRGAHRVGDAWAAHTCPDKPETHAGVQATGAAAVYVNGRRLARVGDAVSCGSTVAGGSSDVVCGDNAPAPLPPPRGAAGSRFEDVPLQPTARSVSNHQREVPQLASPSRTWA